MCGTLSKWSYIKLYHWRSTHALEGNYNTHSVCVCVCVCVYHRRGFFTTWTLCKNNKKPCTYECYMHVHVSALNGWYKFDDTSPMWMWVKGWLIEHAHLLDVSAGHGNHPSTHYCLCLLLYINVYGKKSKHYGLQLPTKKDPTPGNRNFIQKSVALALIPLVFIGGWWLHHLFWVHMAGRKLFTLDINYFTLVEYKYTAKSQWSLLLSSCWPQCLA